MFGMKGTIILGVGGSSIDILEIIMDLNKDEGWASHEIAFLDDDKASHGTTIFGCKVLGPLSMALRFEHAVFISGIGNPGNYQSKADIIDSTGVTNDRFVSYTHPTAYFSPSATLGRGTSIHQNVTVTNRVRVGNHVIICPSSAIGHDAVIGDYSSLSIGVLVCGNVMVGKGCYLGAGSTIKQGLRIGDGAMIGMGAVVLKDVPAGATMVGNPARRL